MNKQNLNVFSQYSGYNEMPTAGKHLRIDVVDPEAFGYYRLVATSSFGNESTCVLSLSGLSDL